MNNQLNWCDNCSKLERRGRLLRCSLRDEDFIPIQEFYKKEKPLLCEKFFEYVCKKARENEMKYKHRKLVNDVFDKILESDKDFVKVGETTFDMGAYRRALDFVNSEEATILEGVAGGLKSHVNHMLELYEERLKTTLKNLSDDELTELQKCLN